ncbi:hypothetical protein FF011L_16190 [Roseimaritima multifibrata]|uniref:Uncharacterized protein n=1 Tax=Roseimaritima multifibrata TaxID=1930274 RepID=A0A517MDG3_9BACT|nr:hypothetical protein FF011L_16190 [Roseimaritima multifibrata]
MDHAGGHAVFRFDCGLRSSNGMPSLRDFAVVWCMYLGLASQAIACRRFATVVVGTFRVCFQPYAMAGWFGPSGRALSVLIAKRWHVKAWDASPRSSRGIRRSVAKRRHEWSARAIDHPVFVYRFDCGLGSSNVMPSLRDFTVVWGMYLGLASQAITCRRFATVVNGTFCVCLQPYAMAGWFGPTGRTLSVLIAKRWHVKAWDASPRSSKEVRRSVAKRRHEWNAGNRSPGFRFPVCVCRMSCRRFATLRLCGACTWDLRPRLSHAVASRLLWSVPFVFASNRMRWPGGLGLPVEPCPF